MFSLRMSLAAVLIATLAACSNAPSPDARAIDIAAGEAAASEPERADAPAAALPPESPEAAPAGVPRDLAAECAPELAQAEAALADIPPTSDHAALPFDRQRGPACSLFPADFGAATLRDESTSQCNRAILARALVSCIDWSLPTLPDELAAAGYTFRIVEDDTYQALRAAAESGDWLGYLDLGAARRDLERLDAYPEYGTLLHLAGYGGTNRPEQFTLSLASRGDGITELDGELFRFHPRCGDGTADEPCEGSTTPFPARAELALVAIGEGCAANGLSRRLDAAAFGAERYAFDHCSYHVLPLLAGPGGSRPVTVPAFSALSAPLRERLLEGLRYGERTMIDLRAELEAEHARYRDAVDAELQAGRAAFFDTLAFARRFPAVPNDAPLPAACQGEAIDFAACDMPPEFKPWSRQ